MIRLSLTMLVLAQALVACSGGTRVDIADPVDGGVVLSIDVRVAVTAEQRARGLRGAEPLSERDGLLIELPRELDVCIDNGGVTQSIDAIVIASDNVVLDVERDIPAGDETPRCHRASAILEVRAQVAADVAPGHLVAVTEY